MVKCTVIFFCSVALFVNDYSFFLADLKSLDLVLSSDLSLISGYNECGGKYRAFLAVHGEAAELYKAGAEMQSERKEEVEMGEMCSGVLFH